MISLPIQFSPFSLPWISDEIWNPWSQSLDRPSLSDVRSEGETDSIEFILFPAHHRVDPIFLISLRKWYDFNSESEKCSVEKAIHQEHLTWKQELRSMTRLKCDTHRQHWGSRGTRRRNICTPKSCGSWGWRRDSRSTASSSASSPTLWWCPGQGPSWAQRSFRLPSSSTTIVERRIGLPGEEREVFASLLILSKGLLWLERDSTVVKIPGSKDQLPFGAQFDHPLAFIGSDLTMQWRKGCGGGRAQKKK